MEGLPKFNNPLGRFYVSSQYLGVRAGLAPAQVGNRKGLPLLFEKIRFYGIISVLWTFSIFFLHISVSS